MLGSEEATQVPPVSELPVELFPNKSVHLKPLPPAPSPDPEPASAPDGYIQRCISSALNSARKTHPIAQASPPERPHFTKAKERARPPIDKPIFKKKLRPKISQVIYHIREKVRKIRKGVVIFLSPDSFFSEP